MDPPAIPPHLCSRCGAITEPAAPDPDGRGGGTCPDCGLGYSTVITSVFSQEPVGPVRPWSDRRRHSDDEHRVRQADILLRRTFPIFRLDQRWDGLRWAGGWGTSGDETTHIGLAHGDPYDPDEVLVRIDTWPLAGAMAAMTVANAAQGLAEYLWDEGAATHDVVRPTWTSDDPTETWHPLELSVDRAAVAFRTLGSGVLWVALAQIGHTLVAIEARHIEPDDVGLVTIEDVDPYMGDGPTPR
jgi:hypothetical protein